MKKVFLTSVASLAIVFPALANIDKSASTATCDSATIGATSGNAYMDTAWTANTINLQWYNGDTKQTSTTCQYDGAITLPSDPQPRTGYTFGGWKVRVAPSAFDLSTLAQYINTGGSDYYSRGKEGEYDYCYAYGENAVSDDDGIGVCTADAAGLSDIALNQWKTVFSYGTVRGEAVCANNEGEYAVAGTPQGTGGQYCWCRATGFDAEKDGTYQNVASSSWVFSYATGDAYGCASYCAGSCASRVNEAGVFRRAVFGISE